MNRQIEAQIMGQSYMLSAPEHEAADLRAAVQKVDEAMCSIRDAGKIKARDRIAVLAALNLALEQVQAQSTQQPAPERSEDTLHEVPNDTRLAALIYKLDQALGRDGHLL